MINELKAKLLELGMSEDLADQAIAAVAEFGKGKLPTSLHSAVDDVLAGKDVNIGQMAGLLGGLKNLFR